MEQFELEGKVGYFLKLQIPNEAETAQDSLNQTDTFFNKRLCRTHAEMFLLVTFR